MVTHSLYLPEEVNESEIHHKGVGEKTGISVIQGQLQEMGPNKSSRQEKRQNNKLPVSRNSCKGNVTKIIWICHFSANKMSYENLWQVSSLLVIPHIVVVAGNSEEGLKLQPC